MQCLRLALSVAPYPTDERHVFVVLVSTALFVKTRNNQGHLESKTVQRAIMGGSATKPYFLRYNQTTAVNTQSARFSCFNVTKILRPWHPQSHLSDCANAEGCQMKRELWNMCAWHQSVIITRGAAVSPASNCLLLSINKSFQITIKLGKKIQGRPMGIIENNWACGGLEESPLRRSPEEKRSRAARRGDWRECA